MSIARAEWHRSLPPGSKPLWPTVEIAQGVAYPQWAYGAARPIQLNKVSYHSDKVRVDKQAPPIIIEPPSHLTYPVACALDMVPNSVPRLGARRLLLWDAVSASGYSLDCQIYHRPGLSRGTCDPADLRTACLFISWSGPDAVTGRYPRIDGNGCPREITLDSCWYCLINGKDCEKAGMILDGPNANTYVSKDQRRNRTINEMLGLPTQYSVITEGELAARTQYVPPTAKRKEAPTPEDTRPKKRASLPGRVIATPSSAEDPARKPRKSAAQPRASLPSATADLHSSHQTTAEALLSMNPSASTVEVTIPTSSSNGPKKRVTIAPTEAEVPPAPESAAVNGPPAAEKGLREIRPKVGVTDTSTPAAEKGPREIRPTVGVTDSLSTLIASPNGDTPTRHTRKKPTGETRPVAEVTVTVEKTSTSSAGATTRAKGGASQRPKGNKGKSKAQATVTPGSPASTSLSEPPSDTEQDVEPATANVEPTTAPAEGTPAEQADARALEQITQIWRESTARHRTTQQEAQTQAETQQAEIDRLKSELDANTAMLAQARATISQLEKISNPATIVRLSTLKDEAEAAATKARAERDQAIAERDKAIGERDKVLSHREEVQALAASRLRESYEAREEAREEGVKRVQAEERLQDTKERLIKVQLELEAAQREYLDSTI